MSDRPALAWATLPAPIRTLGRWLTMVQALGYTTSLIFVWYTTGMGTAGIAARYRGSDPAASDGAMTFAKSLAEMLTITHTHALSMAAIFALSGLCFALCARPSELWRRRLIAEPFIAIVTSFSAMWLMRYLDPRFSWLLALSSGSMAVVFYLQTWFILHELGWRDRELG